jgi:two-component system CheB/CheR fusion protein
METSLPHEEIDRAASERATAQKTDAVPPEHADRPAVTQFVVGIGASAGGLEAIEAFFDHVPEDSGLTFVVVQHLSPDFKSLMDELLARRTRLPIRRVEDGMAIQPNAVYLIPRKKNMVLSFGKLLLTDQDQKSGPNLPIDIFFHSLAQDMRERAVGVVLSGTGSDGSRGLKDIREAGGLVVVQDPESASFDGMPKAALATGTADLVLHPAAMPAKIVQYVKHPVRADLQKGRVEIQSGDELDAVFSLLRRHFGVDFSLYKPSTLGRRMERRMTLQNVETLAAYVARLETDSAELDHLYRDLLVEVTQFFRDKEAFDILKSEVIPKLFEQASAEDGLRVWAPGCATGEEAYSLAMLFHEHAEACKRNFDIKIFATDVHRTSLEIASAGAYREASVAELPRSYLERYFVHKRHKFVVNQELRRMVIFAPHNLTKDPPFTKLDLIVCRNVLIYLNPAAQRKILTLFHFGLRTGGVLFLGPSENVTDLEDEFDVVDRHWKMYRKRRDIRLHPGTGLATMPLSETAMLFRHQLVNLGKSDAHFPDVYENLLARYVPPSLLLNEHHELVHSFGDARKYLQVPEGKATNDLLKMLDHPLRIAVSSALHQAAKTKTPVVYSGVRTKLHGQEIHLKVSAVPLPNKRTQSDFFQVCLEPEAGIASPPESQQAFDVQGESVERITGLERELMYAKEHLQSTIEELETSNEELQSTNEELVASNEELQSTNEELHSVNEELYTVNAEHQRKIEELIQLTSDMDNLLASTDIGTIFLDLDLNIRKFTPAIARLFNLMPHDVGRPFKHISNNLKIDNALLEQLIERLHADGAVVEQEIEGPNRRAYLIRVLPYRSQNGQIVGTVLTFVDITAVKEAKQELGTSRHRLIESEQRFQAVLDNSTALIFVKDLDGRYTFVNRQFATLFGGEISAVLGKTDSEIFPEAQAQARLACDRRIFKGEAMVESEETMPRGDQPRTYLSIRFPLRDSRNHLYAVAGISTDITDRKRAEIDARDALTRRDQFLAMLSHELRNPLGAILNATQVLGRKADDPFLHQEARLVIQRQIGQMARLLDDLLDVARIAQNRIRLQKAVLDLRDIANEAVHVVRSQYEAASVQLNLEIDTEPLSVFGDAARLQQLMVNLLLNAAKYTPSGGNVCLKLQSQGEHVVIRVKDTGAGIRQEMLERVFDLFVQANDTLHRSEGGMGVGLTLVRTIVELHGGSVKAFSDGPGSGSEFVIVLPHCRERPAENPTPTAAIPNDATILIVEDNPDSRRMLEAMLKLDGYDVRSAADGKEGLTMIRMLRPHFALIDIGLPELDGYQVAKQVRADPACDETMLIALTGYGRSEDRRAVQEAGFDEHLVKPLKPDELTRLLCKIRSERDPTQCGEN